MKNCVFYVVDGKDKEGKFSCDKMAC